MEIKNSGASELTISGNIKSIDDYTAIKNSLNALVSKGTSDIGINIPDSFSMPSSIIGFLLKLKQRENIRLRVVIGDARLFTLLNDLNLVTEFGAVLKK